MRLWKENSAARFCHNEAGHELRMHNPEVLTSLGLPQGIKNINLINDLRMKMGFLPLGLPALKRVKNASFFPIFGDRKLPRRYLNLGRKNTPKTYQNKPQCQQKTHPRSHEGGGCRALPIIGPEIRISAKIHKLHRSS